jgi:hypothetical protein
MKVSFRIITLLGHGVVVVDPVDSVELESVVGELEPPVEVGPDGVVCVEPLVSPEVVV